MSTVSSATQALATQGAQESTGYDAFSEVNLQDFIALLVAELQNQDPLNPMDNSEILVLVIVIASATLANGADDLLIADFEGGQGGVGVLADQLQERGRGVGEASECGGFDADALCLDAEEVGFRGQVGGEGPQGVQERLSTRTLPARE